MEKVNRSSLSEQPDMEPMNTSPNLRNIVECVWKSGDFGGDSILPYATSVSTVSTARSSCHDDENDEDHSIETNHALAPNSSQLPPMSAEMSPTRVDPVFPLVLIVGLVTVSGVVANLTFDKLNQIDPGCGSVLTVVQYLFVITEKAPSHLGRSPSIPWHVHAGCAIFMYGSAALGNLCLAFHLPFSLYLVIKNANPIVTILVGFTVLGKRFNSGQVLSVAMLSTGIIMSVLSQQEERDDSIDSRTTGSPVLGALLCICSCVSMACLGFTQEYAFTTTSCTKTDSMTTSPTTTSRDGSAEMMFYTHLFGLPFFFTPNSGMMEHLETLSSHWQWTLPLGFVNVLAVVGCKQSFFMLLKRSSSLTATLCITIYRFIGILLSVLTTSGSEPPTLLFWVGTATVAIGTLSYVLSSQNQESTKCKQT